MSGRAIGQVVGVALAYYFQLGPIGMAIGGAIGSAIGGTFDPTQSFEGPRLSDLRVNGSSYGLPIPLHYGEGNRTAGVIIWSTGLIESRKKEKSAKGGGGGSAVTTYSYRTSVAISLGEGECHNIRRIWANSKLLWSLDATGEATAALQTKADKLDAQATAAEAAFAAALDYDPYLESQALYLRQKATDAQAAADAAAANNAIAQAGGQPWTLEKGAGLPKGPLKYLAFYPGNTTQLPDPTVEAGTGAGNAPAYRRTCYIVLGDLQLADYGNQLPNIEVELDGLPQRSVASIVHDVCERSGMRQGEYTVSAALASVEVLGYSVATAGNAMAAITPLAGVFFFDPVEQGGEVRFVSRGHGPVCHIPIDHTAARERQDGETPLRVSVERLADFDLPREVTITFRDPERDYQDNTQRATRMFGDAYSVVDLQAAVTMSAGRARQVADRALWGRWTDRLPSTVSVTDKYRFLQVGDVVTREIAGAILPFRIEHRVRGANGLIELDMRQEDPFVYEGSTDGASVPTVTAPTSLVVDTFAAAMNAPILGPGQPATGFMWAMDAEEGSWAGGSFMRSTDGGFTWFDVDQSSERNITGTVAAALPAGGPDVWDRENVITVTLRNGAHELESVTEAAVLNGANGVWLGAADGSHGEVLQFATATLVTSVPRVYELSDLLRGRRATEHEVGAHGTDEVFVLLESDLLRSADYDIGDWDRERRYKGVSVYELEDDVVDYQLFTNTGERARPRSPVHGTGERDGSNNLTISWVRRIRGFQPGLGYGLVALDEQTEAYEVDVMDGATVLRTIAVSTPSATYSAADQTADGLTPGDPVTVRVYQLSATRGRGHAGEFIV